MKDLSKINRRQFIKRQASAIITLPLISSSILKPKDILDFQIGVWGSDKDMEVLESLSLPNINFKMLDKPGRAPLFTNAILIAGEVEKRADLAMEYLQKYPVLMALPSASSMEEFNKIRETAEQEEHLLSLISPLQFLPSIEQVNQILDDNKLGGIKSVKMNISANVDNKFLKALAGGALDWHFHLIYLVTHLLDLTPSKLKVSDSAGNDYKKLIINTENNAGINLNIVNNLQPDELWVIEMEGEKGMIRLKGNHAMLFRDKSGTSQIFDFADDSYEQAFETLVLDFVDSVKDEKEPEVGFNAGRLNIILHEAVKRSLETGENVSLVMGE